MYCNNQQNKRVIDNKYNDKCNNIFHLTLNRIICFFPSIMQTLSKSKTVKYD